MDEDSIEFASAPPGNNGHPEEHDPRAKPRQVSAHARQFLKGLGRDSFEFRCFHDQKDRKGRDIPQQLHGSFNEHKHALRLLNDNGYGIFVQVNENDGKGNKAENITSAPVFFADLDGTPLENIERLALPPHLVVSSSSGKYHAYWRVNDIPLASYKTIQQRLAKVFDSDPAVCDLPRVMRLPGFLHQKDPSSPYLVHPLQTGEHSAFSFPEFQSALAAAEAIHRPAADSKARLNRAGSSSNTREGDLARDEQMLRHLIGSGKFDLAEYKPWIDLGIALKNSHGDAGFSLWHALSAEADNYEDEENCREAWDRIKPLVNEADRRTVATYWKQAKEGGFEAAESREFQGTSSRERSTSGGPSKPDQAVKVLEAADVAGDERFLDLDGNPFVRFRHKVDHPDEHWMTTRIDSEPYHQVLRRRFYRDAVTKTLAPEQLRNAISLLAAEATEADIRHPVHLRSGWFEGKLYIDLARGDGQVAEVDGEGYRILPETPIRFVQGSRGPLPVPEAGGTLSDLARHLPALELAEVQRVLGFAVSTFYEGGTFPMLLISGGQGTSKSTIGDMILAFTDPPIGRRDARFSFTSKEQDLLIHASSARVLYFDNVSTFGGKASDTLCRLLSGAAFSTRMLYTNGEEHRIALRRPIITTSLETPSQRGDLLDRMIQVTARHTGRRRTEEEVWQAFEADLPKLFGLVLRGISHAIRNMEDVASRVATGRLQLPRLADVAQFVEGAAEVLELPPGEFCSMLRHEQSSLQAEAASGDTLGAALVRYFSRNNVKELDVTAAELLEKLEGINECRRDWPGVNKVRGRLQRIEPGLRDIGIDLQFTPPKGKRNVWTMQIKTTDRFYPDQSAKDHF